jgi:tetratricopeptide (TPR) repeat protein
MQEILNATVGRRTAVVHGLGGIGKTQLAIAYIKRHRLDNSAAIWLNAKDETALKQSFARAAEWILRHHPAVTYIAGALESQDLDETMKAVKRWLDEPMNNRWLLVYDNYDNPLLENHTEKSLGDPSFIEEGAHGDDDEELARAFDLRKYFPDTDHGAIVVTTRSSMVKLGQTVLLRKLDDIRDSLEVLASVSGREDLEEGKILACIAIQSTDMWTDPGAADLARELDGFPLALATAGAYLEQVSISCKEYLQLYSESWQRLHEETPQLPAYDQTLYSTWNLSYRYIQQRSPITATLLRQWAYFANEDLWYELLEGSSPDKPEWLEALIKDKLTFHASLRLLCSHGLVEADPPTTLQLVESRGYSVHRCVHSWMIHVLNQGIEKKMAWTAVRCVAERVPEKDENKSWLLPRRLMAHADRCLQTIRKIEVEVAASWDLHCLGLLYIGQDRLQEAEVMCDRALEGYERASGRGHPSTLNTLHSLGLLYAGQNRLQEAEAMYDRVLEGYEKAWGRGDIQTLDVVNNLGVLYADQGRVQEAEAMYDRALKGYEEASGPKTTSTLKTLTNLGNLFIGQGRLQEAEVMYNRALEGKEKAWGPEHTSTLNTLNNLGYLYAVQGRLQKAEAMYNRALEGKEKAWGPEHTSTLDTINNFGNFYKNQGLLHKAEAMYDRALKGMEKTQGPEHTLTLQIVHNLGILYADRGQLQEAEAMYERALEGKEKTWGPEHTSTLHTVNNLGIVYADQGRLQEAEAMYKRALEGYAKSLGAISFSTYIPALNTLEGMGVLYQKQGNASNALLYFHRALDGIETVSGRQSEAYSRVLRRLDSLQHDRCEETSETSLVRTRTSKPERRWSKMRAKLAVMTKPR